MIASTFLTAVSSHKNAFFLCEFFSSIYTLFWKSVQDFRHIYIITIQLLCSFCFFTFWCIEFSIDNSLIKGSATVEFLGFEQTPHHLL